MDIDIVMCTVARAHYPLGPRWGITVLPQVGRPSRAVMPEVGAGPCMVMARGGAAVSVQLTKILLYER